MKIEFKNRNRRYASIISVVGLICLLAVLGVIAYSDSNPVPAQDQLRVRVSEIIRESLRRGTGNINGVEVYTRMPISSRLVEEIKSNDEKVIPILADHLAAENPQERLIAVSLLGAIGRPAVVPYLGKVVRDDSSLTIQIAALRWISSIDHETARDVIIEVSESASNEKVREEAQYLRLNFKVND